MRDENVYAALAAMCKILIDGAVLSYRTFGIAARVFLDLDEVVFTADISEALAQQLAREVIEKAYKTLDPSVRDSVEMTYLASDGSVVLKARPRAW